MDRESMANADVKHRIRLLEIENRRLQIEKGRLIGECNEKLEMNSIEARRVQIENDRLTKENGEMRDLCCYLDEDRAKTRKLCKEWQKFARHTAKLMKQEASSYRSKIADLDRRYRHLIDENDELKRICLFLDGKRINSTEQQQQQQQKLAPNEPCRVVAVPPPPSSSSTSTSSSPGEYSDILRPESDQNRSHQQEKLVANSTATKKELRTATAESLTIKKALETGRDSSMERSKHNESTGSSKLMAYIQELELRINKLEKTETTAIAKADSTTMMKTAASRPSEVDEELAMTIAALKRGCYDDEAPPSATSNQQLLVTSQISTTSSTGTAYGSSCSGDSRANSQSPITAVYVLPHDNELIRNDNNNAIGEDNRTLTPIDEEEYMTNDDDECELVETNDDNWPMVPWPNLITTPLRPTRSEPIFAVDDNDEKRGQRESAAAVLMPAAVPVIGRRRQSLGTVGKSQSLSSPHPNAASGDKTLVIGARRKATINDLDEHRKAISEAVKVLRVQEMAVKQAAINGKANNNQHGLMTDNEKALIKQMCKIAWTSIDSAYGGSSASDENLKEKLAAKMSAV